MIIGEFNDAFPPEIDGVGTVVRSYATELAKFGDQCYYVAPNAPDYDKELEFRTLLYQGVKVPGEPYHLGIPLIDIRYLRQVSEIEFDIVHAHTPFTAGFEAARIAKERKIPLIGTFHSKYHDDFYYKTKSKVIADIGTKAVVDFYNRCDEVWTVNNSTADVLRGYGYEHEIIIMPNGTNTYEVKPNDIEIAKSELGLRDETVLLFVGQMNWKKNIRLSIDSVAQFVKMSDKKVKMIMIGQGPSAEEIIKYVKEKELSDVFLFTGHISDRDKLMTIYACADLFIFPSIYDNAPMVVREAAAAGTPSVLVEGSCASEGISDGYNGFLCKESPEALAETIARALPLSKEVGERAKATVPTPWSEIITEVRNRYIKLSTSVVKV